VDIAIVATAMLVAGAGVLFDENAGPLEFVFGTVMIGVALLTARVVLATVRRTVAARAAAARLAGTRADDLARSAVVEERVRLAADIEAVVRVSVTRMAASADAAERGWAGDPVPALRAVQDEGRHATADLRRMLGLLRDAAAGARVVPVPPVAPRRMRTDAWTAVAVAVFAVAEHFFYNIHDGWPQRELHSVTSVVLTAAAAATLGSRRVAPGAGAGACGLIFLLGAVVDRPVDGGFWTLLTVCGLGWTAAARIAWRHAIGAVVLVAGVTVARQWRDPVDGALEIRLVVLAVLGGALVGWLGARGSAARRAATRMAADLDAAVETAVHAERIEVARDLHDVLSHAVGVMVVQAGAAEMLWVTGHGPDRARARAALGIVRRTARETLSELDGLVVVIREGAMGRPCAAGGTANRDTADLHALIARMRDAGLDVRLELDGAMTGDTGTAVYRIVQESMTNALRHAPSSRVWVSVCTSGSAADVTVVDDGPGPSGTSRRGYGLVGIAERVHRLGGNLTTGTGPDGAGFLLHARIPA